MTPKLALPSSPSPRDVVRRFVAFGGTVVGREHRRLSRNNQDGLGWTAEAGVVAAVVTDGCSSSGHSEVGSRLAARWLVDRLPALYGECESDPPEALAQRVCDELTTWLEAILEGAALDPRSRQRWVEDALLFGFLAAVVDRERAIVFGIGDGVWSLNGAVTVLDPGPANAPDYLAYRLLPTGRLSGDRGAVSPTVHLDVETSSVRSLLIGTDGCCAFVDPDDRPLRDGRPLGELAQFEREPRYVRNPSLLEKRLRVAGEIEGLLFDDTTVAVIRRREE